jgi:transcriptional regulator with XRE-family HTH domain
VTIESEPNPTAARRELAVYFRRLREQRGRSLRELGELLHVTQGQASRLDSGARGFHPQDVERLCELYGVGRGERRRLLAVAEEARRRAWWQQYDLSESYRTLIGLERAAESISEFCSSVVPGLLQTRRYAEALGKVAEVSPVAVVKAVDVRMRRQAILDRSDAPYLSVLIDEVVLARGAGSGEVMWEQFQKLLSVVERPRVSVRVIAFEAGMYGGTASQFILLRMGSSLPDVYYSEDQVKAEESSDEEVLRRTRLIWGRMEQIALDPVRSAQLIASYRDRVAP